MNALAIRYDYLKLRVKAEKIQRMMSYRKDDIRLNVWLTTATVASSLVHPKQGPTQLFRRDQIEMSQLEAIFNNPRVHTDAGYQRTIGKNGKTSNSNSNRVSNNRGAVATEKKKRSRADLYTHDGDSDDGQMGVDEAEENRPIKRSQLSCSLGKNCPALDSGCRFEHRCRYNSQCTRHDCMYTHDEMSSAGDEWWYRQECYSGAKCIFQHMCKFIHPLGTKFEKNPLTFQYCRYGSNCNRPDCWYSH